MSSLTFTRPVIWSGVLEACVSEACTACVGVITAGVRSKSNGSPMDEKYRLCASSFPRASTTESWNVCIRRHPSGISPAVAATHSRSVPARPS